MSSSSPQPDIRPTPDNRSMCMERLSRYISDNQLKPGDRLPAERKLAELFGFSRSTVRAVLGYLAKEQLVESRQGDGTYLCSPNMSDFAQKLFQATSEKSTEFDEILELRMIFEPAIARLAAVRWKQEQLDALKVIVFDQQRCLLRNEGDGNLDEKFHIVLASCTQNSLLESVARQVNEKYRFGREDEFRPKDAKDFSIASHLRIIEALENRDPDACENEILFHLNTVRQTHVFSSVPKEQPTPNTK